MRSAHKPLLPTGERLGELVALRDTLVRRETENASLQTSLDLVVGENAQLSRRRTENDAAAAQASAQLELAKTSLAEAEARATSWPLLCWKRTKGGRPK